MMIQSKSARGSSGTMIVDYSPKNGVMQKVPYGELEVQEGV
jgi:hypothetical protein